MLIPKSFTSLAPNCFVNYLLKLFTFVTSSFVISPLFIYLTCTPLIFLPAHIITGIAKRTGIPQVRPIKLPNSCALL